MEKIPGLEEAIAGTVRELRAKTGFSQEKFADFAGLSRVCIAQLEAGTRAASINGLMLIAKSVNLKGSELIKLIEQKLG